MATPGIVNPAFHKRNAQTRLVERRRDIFVYKQFVLGLFIVFPSLVRDEIFY